MKFTGRKLVATLGLLFILTVSLALVLPQVQGECLGKACDQQRVGDVGRPALQDPPPPAPPEGVQAPIAEGEIVADNLPDNAVTLTQFINGVLAMGSITGVVVILINLGKSVGLVKDGDALLWNQGLHAAIYIVLILWFVIHPDVGLDQVDIMAQQVSQFGGSLLALVPLLIALGGLVNQGIRGFPFVGFSHSLK